MNTVFFDLDGTLLPINQDRFVKKYMDELSKKMEPLGYEKERTIKAVWTGTKAMILNDGKKTNAQRFWDAFASELGESVRDTEEILETFYRNEFNNVKSVMGPAPYSEKAVSALKDKNYKLVLATNPIFPRVAVKSRLEWIGIDINVFDHVTSYEYCSYCKPNLDYYREILRQIGRRPEQCLMVGNNVREDMCAISLGMSGFLVTDNIENEDNEDISKYRGGSMQEFLQLAEDMEPAV